MQPITDFSNITFHAHSMGKLMVDPKGKSNMEKYLAKKESILVTQEKYKETKNKETKTAQKMISDLTRWNAELVDLELKKDQPKLSDTCISELIKIYTELTTGRTSDVHSKYMEKGLAVEEDAITAYSLYTQNYFVKNKARKYNDWVEGELDIEEEEIVTDTKSNWDIFTFDKVKIKPILPIYHWQLDTYMWLFNKKFARLAYVLINTPKHLVEAEKKKLLYQMFGSDNNYDVAPKEEREIYQEACQKIEYNHFYDDLPIERKIAIFNISRSEERIERIKKRVEECRWFLNNIDKLKYSQDDTDTGDEEMVA